MLKNYTVVLLLVDNLFVNRDNQREIDKMKFMLKVEFEMSRFWKDGTLSSSRIILRRLR
uniref:Uncharacterized protein n=1 Tax=Physcomitrium patens TaxID=3218 RepID=A0A2K1KBV5_PHYPA|nr:hypothetical protein PHYPA_010450 [Physcomitrium patens]